MQNITGAAYFSNKPSDLFSNSKKLVSFQGYPQQGDIGGGHHQERQKSSTH